MKKLFYPYLLAQFPDASRFSEILDLTLQYADTIEIGIPFTDPVADGPVLASAASEVLEHAFSIDSLFELLQSKSTRVPLALMSYANPILAYGQREFMKASAECGAKYLIVPDVPFEESAEWREMTKECGIFWISFISLSTGEERLKRIAAAAEGFVYLLSLKGTTGATIQNHEQIRNKAFQVKKHARVPLALGFGIKSAVDTEPYQGAIDAFIVGSRIVEIIRSGHVEKLQKFYESFRRL